MRIHTSEDVTYSTIYDAARFAGVDVEVTQHGSRTHETAWEVSLTGSSRRRPNNRGKWQDDDSYAATWDEWGMFIGYVFWIDPEARCGSAKYPAYANAVDFEDQTDRRFIANVKPDDLHGDHSWQSSFGYRSCRHCSAAQVPRYWPPTRNIV